MTTPENIVFEKLGRIAILKISNPPQNYLKSPSFIPIDFLNELSKQEDINGILISGVGRHFSAGADVNNLFELAKDSNHLTKEMSDGAELLEAISSLHIPIVAAINGVCWGGGLEIALACHIRIASAKALFAFPEVNSNLMPGLGGIYRVTNLTGTADTLALLMSGETFDAERALQLHIVDQLTSENVLDYALQYINNLVGSKPRSVITSIMHAIHNSKKLPLQEALKEETRMFCELALTEAALRKSEA